MCISRTAREHQLCVAVANQLLYVSVQLQRIKFPLYCKVVMSKPGIGHCTHDGERSSP